MAFKTPYGVPWPDTSLSAVNTPVDDREAMIVAPFLKMSLPPDSSIVKLAVKIFGVDVAVAALPVVF